MNKISEDKSHQSTIYSGSEPYMESVSWSGYVHRKGWSRAAAWFVLGITRKQVACFFQRPIDDPFAFHCHPSITLLLSSQKETLPLTRFSDNHHRVHCFDSEGHGQNYCLSTCRSACCLFFLGWMSSCPSIHQSIYVRLLILGREMEAVLDK